MVYNNSSYTLVDFQSNKPVYFNGSIPKHAASKAFNYLTSFIDTSDFDGKFVVFVIRNTMSNKEYKYMGNRIKLIKPVRRLINGQYMTYNYKNVIGKYDPKLDNL